jgi:precorrin-6A/cobalt-precorrin-6A reductase
LAAVVKPKPAKPKHVLILGGTGDGSDLAARAAAIPGIKVTTSLAGRTRQSTLPAANTRIGGFGGVPGLVDFLQAEQIDILIDATHPFAAQMSMHAAAAAATVPIPHLILVRPAWQKVTSQPADCWIEVPSHEAAAQILPELAQRIFLTIGRQELAAFAHLRQLWFLMRMIDPPNADARVPPGQLVLERGPFSIEQERALLQHYQIGAVVSKNSGGEATYAKILAARELQLPVVMIQRPPLPDVEQVADVDCALVWLQQQL